MLYASLGVVLAPLIGAILAGLFGKKIGKKGAHFSAIFGVGIAFLLSCYLFGQLVWYAPVASNGSAAWQTTLYTWGVAGAFHFQIGFFLDTLTVFMMVVVTFVSLMVHIYTIGYMREDPGYQRFFSYTALFTFSMLMLVMANNFLQLFFGWEAVGLVSYLLIGFWYQKETAIFASLKAFLVNRIGDFGFLIGIAGVFAVFGSLDYLSVFPQVSNVVAEGRVFEVFSGVSWPVMNVICLALFVGAMGKSAQMPLHVWLPDSMEGPTPISALIHAATMVTAGVFMVARMSPLFEYSEMALSVVLVIGALTSFFMGLLAVVNNDIKRIIAYSTLSQLGYMMCAVGASAYAIGIFHLMTHAFFKALLFLGAGAVILAMDHEQDIWKMGFLRKWMPITYGTMLVGSLAMIGFPLFSGFYSKESIIEALHFSTLPGSGLAYWAALVGVFVTALYSFRLIFVVFHTKPRMSQTLQAKLQETPPVIWVPLVLLAIPSMVAGMWVVGPVLKGFFDGALFVLPAHNVVSKIAQSYHSALQMAWHGLFMAPFWLAMGGIVTAYLGYVVFPKIPSLLQKWVRPLYRCLVAKYGFDILYQKGVMPLVRGFGLLFWRGGDGAIIDGVAVDGTAKGISIFAGRIRYLQSGYIYHYAFAMILGVLAFFVWLWFQ